LENKNLVHIGTFGQPQGLKGEIKITMLTTSFESFKSLKVYFADNGETQWHFKNLKYTGNKLIALLEDCKNRTEAFALKGKKIFSLRENFSQTKDNQYYIVDLIGCVVQHQNNKKIGIVTSIDNFGAGDLIEIKNELEKTFYIPMNSENVININIEKKIIIMQPLEGLLN